MFPGVTTLATEKVMGKLEDRIEAVQHLETHGVTGLGPGIPLTALRGMHVMEHQKERERERIRRQKAREERKKAG